MELLPLLIEQERFSEAEPYCRNALRIFQAVAERNADESLDSMISLATYFRSVGGGMRGLGPCFSNQL